MKDVLDELFKINQRTVTMALQSIFFTLVMLSTLVALSTCGVVPKKESTPAETVIHATNVTSVPSVHYIVDAVEFLKEAYSVYADDANRIILYSELFEEKYPECHWNVVAGYTAAHISSQWYVETVASTGKNKGTKDDKDKALYYLIFSDS